MREGIGAIEQGPAAEYDRVTDMAREFIRFGDRDRNRFLERVSKVMQEDMNAKQTNAKQGTVGYAVPSDPYYADRGALQKALEQAEPLSLDNIEAAMQYQSWDAQQRADGEVVREVLTLAAKTILRYVPSSPRRTLALQHIISARMDANAAISFRGRF